MTRGTAYAAMEIILWIAAAGIAGIAIGWLLRRWIVGRHVDEQIQALRKDEERRRSKLQKELTAAELKETTQTAELHRRTADLERAQARLNEREKALAALDEDLAAARSTEMRLESKVEDRESTIASLRASVGKDDRQLAALSGELASAKGTIGTLRKDAEGYRNTIEALRADLDVERRKQKTLATELETATQESTAAGLSLASAREAEERLLTQLAELETAATGADDGDDRLAAVEADLAAAIKDRDAIASRLEALQAEHEECVGTEQKKRSSAPVEETPVKETPAKETQTTTPADLPDKDVAIAKVAEIAARTRGDGPVVDDDLKKIHGIGPKLERLLKGMEITSFHQVANFSAEDIQFVTAALEAFPGRIERDDWMASAAEQHAAKYGEPA